MTAAATPRVNRAARAELRGSLPADLSLQALAVLATASRWWTRRAAEAGLDGWCTDVSRAVAPVPFTDLAPDEVIDELLDSPGHEIAEAYVTSLDSHVRAAGGRHYTPPALADQMWSQTLDACGQDWTSILDPACGAGSLLIAPLRDWLARHCDKAPELVLQGVASAVRGFDLDSAAVWLGNVILGAQLLSRWRQVPPPRRKPLPTLLRVADGLAKPAAAAQVVIMNPPYGRVRLSDDDRKRWGHTLFGHANQYGLFLAGGVEHLPKNGVMTALVPAGFLGGSYSQRLRGYLGAASELQRVAFLAERSGVFATGVLQETVVATFRRGSEQGRVICERITNGDGRYRRVGVGAGWLPEEVGQPWLLPRTPDDVALVSVAARMRHRLADYGWSVSTGPLVWNRRKDQIFEDPRKGDIKIVWAADIDGGRVHQDGRRDRQRYVRLAPAKDSFMVLSRPAVLVQRTTAPEQMRRIVAAALDKATLQEWGARVVVENHVNVLTCYWGESPLSTRILVALLRSEVVDRLYRCLTGSVAVSAYELGAIPLPDAATLERWAGLDDEELAAAITTVYEEPHVEQHCLELAEIAA
ncbi:MAG TPA: N-6 DNA methylase [Micromonosporaceae bacterium]|nr:N-6 DNA methylase [Micromonosporaceae bacterium]